MSQDPSNKTAMSQVRPLSPHLQVYRPQITSILSITHRMTGVALSLGSVLLVVWLGALALGPDAFALVQGAMASNLGRLVLFGFTFAFFYHLMNGLRHLSWDAGVGFDLKVLRITGWLVVLSAGALTVIVWGCGYAARAGGVGS